ncbi:MAG: hypothetical protein KBT87_00675 [Gammaproteobacteria bacterium]|jgi:hypothetical protein|nr:hypothetical protein [Gammaproteobacteria bacterium]MBQ0773167.1 hypothetical protein [Gammaproteobacteria bacterium]
MPLSRVLLTLLLIAVIPLQGIAASAWFEPPCPMEDMMSSANMDMSMHQMGDMNHLDQDQKPDCCLDDETALRTGQQCKQGQSCHAGQVMMAMTSDISAPAFAHLYVASADMPFKPLLSLVAIWRPPSLA